MAKYRVFAQAVVYAYVDVEANSFEEAEDLFYSSGKKLTEDSVTDFDLSHIVDEKNRIVFYK